MPLFIRNCSLAILSGFIALLMISCGPSQSTSEKQAALPVHGEPINAVQNSAPAPKPATTEIVVAQPPATSPTPVPPKPVAVTAPAITAIDAPKKTEETTANNNGYQTVGFDKLASYNFEVLDDAPVTNLTATADKADDQIPAAVKAFNSKKVSIRGFMLPLKVEGGKVTEFLIMKDQSMCCYGATPKITEWVSVKLSGRGIKPIMDQPVSMEGTLHVGAMRENGYLVGIYQMDGDKLIDTADN
jgi:hypothetical protein